MAIEKNWVIKELNVKQELFGKQNVVTAIYYAILFKFTAPEVKDPINYEYNSFALVKEPGSNFTPFEQLTEQQVFDWLFQELGTSKEEIEKGAMQRYINSAYNNNSRPPLPWTQSN